MKERRADTSRLQRGKSFFGRGRKNLGSTGENTDIRKSTNAFSASIRQQYEKEQEIPFDQRSKIEICLPEHRGIYILGPAGHHAEVAFDSLEEKIKKYNGKVQLSVISKDSEFKKEILERFEVLKNKLMTKNNILDTLQQDQGTSKQETKAS